MLALGLSLAACGGDEMVEPCNADDCWGSSEVELVTARPRLEAFNGQERCMLEMNVNAFRINEMIGWIAPGEERTVEIDPAQARAGGESHLVLACPRSEAKYVRVPLFYQQASHILVTF